MYFSIGLWNKVLQNCNGCFSYFCLFVENKRKRNLSAKDFGCVACRNMKRRCDVVAFREERL